jgi:3-deoxy-7-phosphoheptulonate synthase
MIIAGPCAIESYEQLEKVAEFLVSKGIKYIRGGAFKPRTTPDSFQGLGKEGLEMLFKIRSKFGLKIVTEIMDTRDIELFKDVDVVQIGARNMQNYPLLIEVGKLGNTVLLKRGLSSKISEWVGAAGYIQAQGNNDIIMCARGIRTFETETRFTADIDAIPILQKKGFKVIFDPSHSAGRKDLILPLSKAAMACGADGLIVEIHPEPAKALCDASQQLTLDEFRLFLDDLKA